MIHTGAIVERAVRRSGISLAELARKIDVNRRTLYNWFSVETLRPHSVHLIGTVICYDFSKDLPELFNNFAPYKLSSNLTQDTSEDLNQIADYKERYLLLLEKYNDLLFKGIPKEENAFAA